MQTLRSSSTSCFKYFVIIKFSKFCKKDKCSRGKHPCCSLFLIKLQAFRTDCCKAYLLHTLLKFYFPLGKTLTNLIQGGIFRTKSNIYGGAFFPSVKPYFKNVLNSIELPLGSIFYTTHPFVKKLTTLKTSGGKVLAMEDFFFEIRNYAMEWHHQ